MAIWSQFQFDRFKTGNSGYPSLAEGADKWHYVIANFKGPAISSPAIATDGTIYVAAEDGYFYAFNSNGSVKWSEYIYGEDYQHNSPSIASDGTVYIGGSDTLYAFNPDGTTKWSFPSAVDTLFLENSTIDLNGVIYFGTYPTNYAKGRLYALYPNGTEKWHYDLTNVAGCGGTPALALDGTVYIGEKIVTGGTILQFHAVNPNGTEKWTIDFGVTQYGNVFGGASVASDGTIYIGANQHLYLNDAKLYALNPDGTEKWTFSLKADLGSPNAPSIYDSVAIASDGTIYFATSAAAPVTSKLYALNPDGTKKWRYEFHDFLMYSYADIWSSPCIDAEGVIYIERAGWICAINSDGTAKWGLRLPGVGENWGSSPALDLNGTVYIGNTVGFFAVGGDIAGSSSSESMTPSSSSESQEVAKRQLNSTLINQGNNSLIPFTFIGEAGTSVDLGSNSVISFIVESDETASCDYTAVIERDNGALTDSAVTDQEVYVPEDPRAYYEHQSQIYVDIIGQDEGGIRDVRTHVEPDKYEFEEVESSFLIPKFSWDNSDQANVSTTTTTTEPDSATGSFWTGTEEGNIYKIEFGANSVSNVHSANLSSMVNGLLFTESTNKLYISTNEDLYVYSVDTYLESSELAELSTVTNGNGDIMNFYDNNVWSTQAYWGKVRNLDADDLSENEVFSGFDSPFKVKWSVYHNYYLVAGDHILWKLDNGVKTAVYEVNDYTIVDFDVSERGVVCLLLGSLNDDIIRVFDIDLYSFLLDERITDATLKYCKYCQQGRFYIFAEIVEESSTYSAYHYLFDADTKLLNRTLSSEALLVTTTTTTLPITTKAITIEVPNGGEDIEIGSPYNIAWSSSKALGDAVKIELYKGGSFHSLITASTPNTGIFEWTISSFINPDDDYRIKITWLSASSDPDNEDESDADFSISQIVTTTTTTTIESITQSAIGIDYDSDRDHVVFVLRSGLFGTFELGTQTVYGLFDSGFSDLSAMAIGDDSIGLFDKQVKVRIFVGTEARKSDMWDSGEITTELTSIYYGGGKNLVPGKKYYVQIQVYSSKYGWSEVQIKEFIMPK